MSEMEISIEKSFHFYEKFIVVAAVAGSQWVRIYFSLSSTQNYFSYPKAMWSWFFVAGSAQPLHVIFSFSMREHVEFSTTKSNESEAFYLGYMRISSELFSMFSSRLTSISSTSFSLSHSCLHLATSSSLWRS